MDVPLVSVYGHCDKSVKITSRFGSCALFRRSRHHSSLRTTRHASLRSEDAYKLSACQQLHRQLTETRAHSTRLSQISVSRIILALLAQKNQDLNKGSNTSTRRGSAGVLFSSDATTSSSPKEALGVFDALVLLASFLLFSSNQVLQEDFKTRRVGV